MTAPGYLGGPVPTSGRPERADRGQWWHAAPHGLDPAEVRRLTREGLRSDQVADRLGCLLVHVAECALEHGIAVLPAPCFGRLGLEAAVAHQRRGRMRRRASRGRAS